MRSIDEQTGTRRPSFEFFAGPHRSGELFVISFEGKEAASKPFSFDITIAARSLGALVDEILGARAILALNGDDDHGRRAISGIVARVAPEGAVTVDERRLYRVRLVPALWLLGRRKTSRVFQGMSVPEIIDAVLQKAAIDRSWRLSREYPKRDYCVQYQETDLRFVSRLLAEEGVFYFITQPNGDREDQAEIVVFADAAAHYEPIVGEPRLPCRDAGARQRGPSDLRSTSGHAHKRRSSSFRGCSSQRSSLASLGFTASRSRRSSSSGGSRVRRTLLRAPSCSPARRVGTRAVAAGGAVAAPGSPIGRTRAMRAR